MAEMAYSLEGRLLVAVNTKNPVPANEWTACVRAVRAHAKVHWEATTPCILVVTDGGGPDAVQRKAMFEAVPRIQSARGAVLTGNVLVRGVATAFSWFTAGFKVFSPGELEPAIAWLELTKDEKSLVSPAFARARRELGEERVKTLSRAL